MKNNFKVYLAMFLLICLAVSFPMYEAFGEGPLPKCGSGYKLMNGKCVRS